MFEYYITRISSKLRDNLNTEGDFISLEDLLSNQDIPDYCKKHIKAETEWSIYEEGLLRASNANFDYANAELSSICDKLDDALMKSARLQVSKIDATLKRTVMTRINFLTSPRRTMLWFIFRGEPTKLKREILIRLGHFSAYEYLVSAVTDWLKNNDNEIINVYDFDRAISDIEHNEISEYKPAAMVGLMSPIFDLLSDDDNIPTEAAIVFFNDKGYGNLAAHLKDKLDTDRIIEIDKDELIKIIEQFAGPLVQDILPETESKDIEADHFDQSAFQADDNLDDLQDDIQADEDTYSQVKEADTVTTSSSGNNLALNDESLPELRELFSGVVEALQEFKSKLDDTTIDFDKELGEGQASESPAEDDLFAQVSAEFNASGSDSDTDDLSSDILADESEERIEDADADIVEATIATEDIIEEEEMQEAVSASEKSIEDQLEELAGKVPQQAEDDLDKSIRELEEELNALSGDEPDIMDKSVNSKVRNIDESISDLANELAELKDTDDELETLAPDASTDEISYDDEAPDALPDLDDIPADDLFTKSLSDDEESVEDTNDSIAEEDLHEWKLEDDPEPGSADLETDLENLPDIDDELKETGDLIAENDDEQAFEDILSEDISANLDAEVDNDIAEEEDENLDFPDFEPEIIDEEPDEVELMEIGENEDISDESEDFPDSIDDSDHSTDEILGEFVTDNGEAPIEGGNIDMDLSGFGDLLSDDVPQTGETEADDSEATSDDIDDMFADSDISEADDNDAHSNGLDIDNGQTEEFSLESDFNENDLDTMMNSIENNNDPEETMDGADTRNLDTLNDMENGFDPDDIAGAIETEFNDSKE